MRFSDLLPMQLPREDVVLIPHVSLQAILVLDSPDVDIRLWNATVAEMEAAGTFGSALPTHGPTVLPIRKPGPADELLFHVQACSEACEHRTRECV